MPIEVESPEELGYDAIANNLSESSFRDMRLADYEIDGDVSQVLLQYGDHRGLPRLRELVAADGDGLAPDDVIVTAGAAAALFAIATALLGEGGHAVIAGPNYATNLETPRALGADVDLLELRFEDGWALDPERLESLLRPETRLVSLTYPHNPTGAMIDRDQLEHVVAIVEAHGQARLLVDETYRELSYSDPLPMAASLSERALSVSSMSKTYGLPGLRMGWVACREKDVERDAPRGEGADPDLRLGDRRGDGGAGPGGEAADPAGHPRADRTPPGRRSRLDGGSGRIRVGRAQRRRRLHATVPG